MDSHSAQEDIRLLEESLTRAEVWYTQVIDASTNIRMRQTASNLRSRVRGLRRYIQHAFRGRDEAGDRNARRESSSRSPKQALANAVSRLVQGHPESATRMRELTADFARLMCEALGLLRERAPSPQVVAVVNGSRKKMRALIDNGSSPISDGRSDA